MKAPLQRLNDKHRKAAQLMVRGLPLVEVGRLVGLGPNYLSLIKKSPVFQEYEAYCRRLDHQAFVDSLERAYLEPFRLRLEELQRRQIRRRRGGAPPARI